MDKQEIKEFSLITYALERLFYYLQYLSVANLLLKTRTEVQIEFVDEETKKKITKRRGRRIEYYILLWVLVFIPAMVFISSSDIVRLKYACALIASYRIFEILLTAINVNLFDGLRMGMKPHYVSGITRTVILSLINYMELLLLFSIIYSSFIHNLSNAESYLDTFYFSVITQLTIGYGELLPTNDLKLVAASQGIIGFLFAVLVFSRFVSLMSGMQSVQNDGK